MKALTEYITNKDNLLPTSLTVTSVILIAGFVLAQVLEYSFPREPEQDEDKMEVLELVKLEFKPVPPKTQSRKAPLPSKRVEKPKVKRSRAEQIEKPEPTPEPERATVDMAALISGFDAKKFLFDRNPSNRKALQHLTGKNIPTIDTDVSSAIETHDLGDFAREYPSFNSSLSTKRKQVPDGGSQNSIKAGKGSGVRVSKGLSGDAVSGVTSLKRKQASSRGSGGATISIPMTSKASDGATFIDLHDLIEWMKRNPGSIPSLVEYEMDHKIGDLSSSISFRLKGRRFHLFLSCNESDMLLRICLIEGGRFTLLKDNGIREKSNFLTTGTVTRQGRQIHSLVSSRKAPSRQAAVFYGIFWNWWMQQKSS